MKYTFEQLKHLHKDTQREYFKTLTKVERLRLVTEGLDI